MPDFANQLREALESGAQSIHWRSSNLTRDLAKWIAFRDGDKAALRGYIGWPADRPYKIDSIPEKLSTAWADFLYGEDPVITAAHENNQDLLNALIGMDEVGAESDFVSDLFNAVDLACAEGEVWWRIYVDPVQQPYPIIQFLSRTVTVPLMRGKKVLAVAFINEIERSESGVYRHVELHEDEYTYNLLYFDKSDTRTTDHVGSATATRGIGASTALTGHVHTAELPEVWNHGLNMLAGRIPNRVGKDPRLGISEYAAVEDQLFDLNEAHTIDSENYRLAGKKRAIMPERFAKKDGTVDPGEEIFFTKDDWDEMDGDDKGPFKILEYTYDGTSSINRKEDLVGTILTRVGLMRQFVDANAKEGYASSGTALRTRLIPTVLAARGKSRRWDAAVPYILMQAQLVDALPENNNGFGRSWTEPGAAPFVERGSILPEDPQEIADRHARAVGAGLESVETAVKELHPEWDEDEQAAEIIRIRRGLLPLPAEVVPGDPSTNGVVE